MTAHSIRRAWHRALLAAVALGLVVFLRSPSYREYRLQRLDEPGLREWAASRPEDALGHFYLAMARGRSGDTREATAELAKALDLDPALSRARWRLARVLAARGEVGAAEELLQRGLRLDPTAGQLHAELGRLYEERQEFRLGAVEWERAASLRPEDAGAWYHLGRCRMGVNDDSGALPAYRRAAELVPSSSTYQKAVAGILRLQRQYGEAEGHYRRALALDPHDPDAHFGLAKLLRDRDGATTESEASMRRALTLQPDSPLLHYSLAGLCQQRGQLEAAVGEYRVTLRLLEAREPRSTASDWASREQWLARMEGPHFNLARLLQRLGYPAEASHHLTEFRRLSDYRNRANQLLVRMANRPDDAVLHFELARLHAAAGSPQLAEEQYRAGLRLRADPRAQAELLAFPRQPGQLAHR